MNIFLDIFLFLTLCLPYLSTSTFLYFPEVQQDIVAPTSTPALPIAIPSNVREKPKKVNSGKINFNSHSEHETSEENIDSSPASEGQGVPVRNPKPKPEEWIRGREPEEKLNLISWLIDGCFISNNAQKTDRSCGEAKRIEGDSHPPEFQTFDGFFNNILKTDLGAVDTPLLRRVPPVYDDGVYLPVTINRENPLTISDALMNRTQDTCQDTPTEPCGSRTGKTALLVFFGQQVAEEMLDVQRPGCPPEYFNIKIPSDHKFYKTSPFKKEMPLLRSRYSQTTGQSPGNPRQQLNEITPWFDGGLVYGTAKGWADVLRIKANGGLAKYGQLASENDEGYFPVRNKIRLPLANPPPPARHCQWTQRHSTADVSRFFVLGNPRGNENAFLLSFGILLFRWHNQIASYLHMTRPKWSGERIFQEARMWVIATHQQIVYYDWLPQWLGEDLEKYEDRGYDPSVDPQIEQFFQTAAFRFGHTLVPPGVYMRDYACAGCDPISFQGLKHNEKLTYNKSSSFLSNETVRTCNIYWRPQEPLEMRYESKAECLGKSQREFADIDRMLMGMASQRAEREDNMIVEDLRGSVFGSLEFSRRDLMAVNIQRGRDHGTPDYNTARESFNLSRICSVDDFIRENQLNKEGTNKDIRKVIEKLANIHHLENTSSSSNKSCWNNIDVWTGGILETNKDRPGPLFRRIIKDQFTRIRHADRFWFENKNWKNPRFSDDQIMRIKELKIFDLIVSTTRMKQDDIQENPFSLPDENFMTKSSKCKGHLKQSTCWKQNYSRKGDGHDGDAMGTESSFACFHLPQLQTKGVDVEECTLPGTYDYFSGSEIPFIALYVSVGLIILGVGSLVSIIAASHRKKKQMELMKITRLSHESKGLHSGLKGLPFPAREWQGHREGTRGIMAILTDNQLIEIRNLQGQLLRNIDMCGRKSVDVIIASGGTHLVIKNPKEYDCVLEFEGPFLREAFYNAMKDKHGKSVSFCEQSMGLMQTLSGATTKSQRITRLEKFFRVVFAHAFKIDEPSGGKELLDPKVIGEVINTELTRLEFADALGMRANSNFVQKMFDLVDRDRNGFISFREFLDMLIIFAKGTAEDKAKLFFEMYDIERDGKLSVKEFREMIRSLVEAANAEVANDDVEALVQSMLEKANLKRDSHVSLEDFQRLLSQYKGTLGYAQLNFSGANVPQEAQQQVTSNRRSFIENARAAVFSIYEETAPQPTTEVQPLELTVVTSTKQEHPQSKWIGLYRLQIFWCTLYTLILLAIFSERAYYYSIEREHAGLRHIAGYGVSITRGAASAMMFTYSTLLLTMCRNSITHLRETFLHRFIPFDALDMMHKYIAVLGLLFSFIHIIGHGINFYHISTQTASDLSCLFREYFRPTHILPKFQYWSLHTLTGITGILLVVHSAFIYFFSTNYARTHAFRMFWIIHGTYPLWYVLMLLHGSARLVQEPIMYTFLTGPLVIFVLDKFVTTSRKKVEIPVIKAEILPSNVTKLEFSRPTGFEYKSGQWVRIACKALNSHEFHPFTLSSAPDESTLTVHIRAVGPFTANIRRIYEGSKPKLYLEGPYGEGHQDWWRYEVSVLIGGGIGVTPFASILKDVARNANPRSCKKVYFLWVTRTQKQFEWLVDIIREVESNKIISVHVFVTQIYNKFDLRTVLLYICEQHFQKVSNRSLFTGLKSKTHFGRPDFAAFFRAIRGIHPKVRNIGVFSCGPMPMSKTVDEACSKANDSNSSGVIFQHHFENF